MTNRPLFDPSVSALFDDFFSTFQSTADSEVKRRIGLVRRDLMDHMDEEGWRVLDPAQTVLLKTEQQFRSKGAFARSAHASDLFCILEHYLDPVHAQVGIEQRATQLDVVQALCDRLWSARLISTAMVRRQCRIEFETAMRRGRSQVAEARHREVRLSVKPAEG